MKIDKTLCCLDKDKIEKHLDDIVEIVAGAKYVCRRCARVSTKKKYLCKPMKLEKKK